MEEARQGHMDHPLLIAAGYPVLLTAITVLWTQAKQKDRKIEQLNEAMLAEKDRQIRTLCDLRDMLLKRKRKA